jgi:hypothetical protein
MKKLLLVMMLATSFGSVHAAAKAADTSTTNKTGSDQNGPTIGKASVADASIGRAAATTFVWSDGINPNQGPNGNTSGFNSSFASFADSAKSSWALVGASSNNKGVSGSTLINDATVTWGYTVNKTAAGANPSGTWWVSSNKALVIDLALDVHASSSSAAWLFDNLKLGANTTQNGTFSVNWTNNGGSVPGFSNFTLFARDAKISQNSGPSVSPVPEPETYAMMLAALGVITLVKRRKSKV